jgi:uncharacterized membrane protein (DUF4010 family)
LIVPLSGQALALALLVAAGGGLLVGADRERRKGQGPTRSAIGLRTCVIVSLVGAIASLVGEAALLVSGLGVGALALASYWRSHDDDPGLTTEFALLATFLLGALACTQPAPAAALFVAVAIVLAGKAPLHRFIAEVVGQQDLEDVLRLAALALIVLPMLPDRTIDPWAVINPHSIGLIAILVMCINAAGYIALRAFGASRGLVLAAFLGGFVSSTATIAAMAQRARAMPALGADCAAAAAVSNVATSIQLAALLAVVSPELLHHVAIALAFAGALAAAIGIIAVARLRSAPAAPSTIWYGRPLAFRQAVLFALVVASALLAAALLRRWMGDGGAMVAAGVAGLADVHAAAISLGQMVHLSSLPPHAAAEGLAIAFTANSLVKMVAAAGGGRYFAVRVIAATLVVNAAFVAMVWLA